MATHFRGWASAVLLSITAGSAAAQNIDLAMGAEQIWLPNSAGAKAGTYLDRATINNDGRPDLIMTAPGNATTTGQVFISIGGPIREGSLRLSTADMVLTGAGPGDRFGAAVAAGNVLTNTDTRDLLVGAPDAGGSQRGIVYVFRGPIAPGARLTTANAAYTIVGRPGDRLGSSLATGDLNNDLVRELIIGAPGTSHVYVLYGGALSGTRDLSVTAPDVVISGTGIGDIVASGDLTGDNIYDVAIGAPSVNAGAGQVSVVFGRTSRLPSAISLSGGADVQLNGADPGDNFGASVRVGNFDNDHGPAPNSYSLEDLLIGAPGGDGRAAFPRTDSGEAYVFWGPLQSSLTRADAGVVFYGAYPGYRTGAVVGMGDINRDVPNDLMLLAPGANGGSGMIQVFYGRTKSSFGREFDIANGFDRAVWGKPSDGPLTAMVAFELTGEGARDIVASFPNAQPTSDTGGTLADGGIVYIAWSPRLLTSPTSLSLRVPTGSATSVPLSIQNDGAGVVPWSVRTTGATWLSTSATTGESSRGYPQSFTVFASAAGLEPGSYTGSVVVKSETMHLVLSRTVPVTLTVTGHVITMPDVDGDGVNETVPVTPRMIFGLGKHYSLQGGWMLARAGSDYRYGTTHWVRVPWNAYNNTGGETYPAVGDLDGDGRDEIVIGLGHDGHGEIVILDDAQNDYALLARIPLGWDAYANANGVIYPAVGNIDGDSRAEIVLGLGSGGQGWFKVLDDASTNFATIGWYQSSWAGYNAANGELHPAIGDLDGNGSGEIILGMGTSSQGWLEIRNGLGGGFGSRQWIQSSWLGYDMMSGGGITWPACGNLDGDARDEIVIGLGRGSQGWMEIRDDLNASLGSLKWIQTGFQPYEAANGETHPAVGDINGAAGDEIVVGLGSFPANGGWVQIRGGAATNFAPIGWTQTGWSGYDANGGPVFPAVGKLR